MADELTPVEGEAAAPPSRKKGGWLRKLLVLTVLMIVAGAGGAWWLISSSASAVEAQEPEAPPIEARGLVSFDPFLVNLADPGGQRFLKATIQIVLPSAEAAAHLEENPVVLMHLRSMVLELLTEQHAAELVTAAGKQALRDEIRERASAALTSDLVLDVLFSEFVVQF